MRRGTTYSVLRSTSRSPFPNLSGPRRLGKSQEPGMRPMNPPSGFLRRTAMRTFRDRREAGRVLAEELASYRQKDPEKDDVLVFGLARGGVPVAWGIGAALHAPLDVFLVRKLGVPRWSELAMGA